MKGIRIDPEARTVRAEPGVLWQEIDKETHAFGMATPGGTVGTTGIAGLTLGGGQSSIAGKYGLTIDNLLSVDIVTADGQLRHASAGRTPTFSGPSAAPVTISAWPHPSNTGCTRCIPCSAACSSTPSTGQPMCCASIGSSARPSQTS